MKVFLTGATGYVGSAVVEQLLAGGHAVLGLAHSEENVTKLQSRGIIPVQGDLYQPATLVQAIASADAVIHTAQGHDFATAQAANAEAVEVMLTALEGTNKPFIFTSGSLVLGDTGQHIADEETLPNPPAFVQGVVDLEQKVLAAASSRGIRGIVIRPTVVYGRGGSLYVPLLFQLARQSGAGVYLGSGENLWPTIHVDELALVYRLTLETAPAGTILNATTGPSYKVRDIAGAVSRSIGATGKTESWPVEQGVAALGPFAYALLMDQQISQSRTQLLLGRLFSQQPDILNDIEYGSYRQIS